MLRSGGSQLLGAAPLGRQKSDLHWLWLLWPYVTASHAVCCVSYNSDKLQSQYEQIKGEMKERMGKKVVNIKQNTNDIV